MHAVFLAATPLPGSQEDVLDQCEEQRRRHTAACEQLREQADAHARIVEDYKLSSAERDRLVRSHCLQRMGLL